MISGSGDRPREEGGQGAGVLLQYIFLEAGTSAVQIFVDNATFPSFITNIAQNFVHIQSFSK